MRLEKLHHIALIASDYQVSRRFYTELLGFEIIREHYREERGDWKLDLRCGECELELFGMPGSPPRVTNPEACGLRHLAFAVDDLKAAVDWLTKQGIAAEPIRIDPFTGCRATFFKDPDGLPLELYETNQRRS